MGVQHEIGFFYCQRGPAMKSFGTTDLGEMDWPTPNDAYLDVQLYGICDITDMAHGICDITDMADLTLSPPPFLFLAATKIWRI